MAENDPTHPSATPSANPPGDDLAAAAGTAVAGQGAGGGGQPPAGGAGGGAGGGGKQPQPGQPSQSWWNNNPIWIAVISVPFALVFPVLAGLVGGEDLDTTSREQRGLVTVAAVVLLLGILVAVIAQLDIAGRRRTWKILSACVSTAAFILYAVASARAQPSPTVERIVVSHAAAGATIVRVPAHDLHGRQQLHVRATWPGGKRGIAAGHRPDGTALDRFVVPAPARAGSLQVVAWVSNVKNAGAQPAGESCGDYMFCSDLQTPIAGTSRARPDLTVALNGRRLTVRIARDPLAPDRALVLVFRRHHEIFKDNPAVTAKAYRTTLNLNPRRGSEPDGICVVATYRSSGARGCAPDAEVTHKVFQAPR
ncbi:MAG: hypothetical protein ABUL56_02835 [Actinomycetota bacterium]